MRVTGVLCAVAVAAALTGCAGKYGQRVPDAMVSKLPFEARIELLESENELALAVDRRDEAQNEILRTREALRRAKSRRDDAKAEVKRAKDAPSLEVADLALAEADARLHFLRARQKVTGAVADVEELALRCALARFELSRLSAARKAKVEGSEKLDPLEFEAQAKACEADVVARRAKVKEGRAAEAEAARAQWETHKNALAKKTFDARASPWVE